MHLAPSHAPLVAYWGADGTAALSVPTRPAQTVRAHKYVRSSCGGSALAVLSVLSQLHADKYWLVASLGSSQEARSLTRELEAEGVSTWYCEVWEGACESLTTSKCDVTGHQARAHRGGRRGTTCRPEVLEQAEYRPQRAASGDCDAQSNPLPLPRNGLGSAAGLSSYMCIYEFP